jgi:hypothetical protein
MKKILVLSLFSALVTLPAGAQRKVPELVGIAPYAGYMKFGSMWDGPYETRVGTSSAPVVGAQLNINVAPGISLLGNVGYASPNLEVGVPFFSGISVGKSTVWMYDAGLQLGGSLSKARTPISPFVQLGAGAMRYDVDVLGVNLKSTNFAGNVGVGADVGLIPNVSIRLLAKDYIGKFDIKEATYLDVKSNTSHNVMFSAGLKLAF